MGNLLVTMRIYIPFILTFQLLAHSAIAGDWSMWRYDSGHTASSPDNLPDQLKPIWTRKWDKREQAWDDPLNNDLMTYDKVFEPIVYGKRMFIGFNDSDKLIAIDTESGKTLWTFYADGPIRFSPVAAKNRVYTVSDDGYLYCLSAENGSLIWKFRGAPAPQKTLGNKRVISAWPARGGPVIYDDTIYFAASIWPFMGTFIYALDAETGNVNWVNDSTSASYIKQPHSAPAFAGVAPQGTLVATKELLLVPGGRSVPAALDRKTGQLKYFHLGGKGNGGSFVIANSTEFFVHTRYRGVRAYNLNTGLPSLFVHNEPVLSKETIYSALLKNKQPIIKAYKNNHQELWSLAVDGQGDMIQAGNRLYAAGEKTISAITLPATQDQKPKVAWQLPIQKQVLRLLAADDKLFAVTSDGEIKAFGVPSNSASSENVGQKKSEALISDLNSQKTMKSLLKLAQTKIGYAICYGADNEPLFDAFLQQSPIQLTVIEENLDQVQKLRIKYDSLGLYGSRITVHQGTPDSFQAPQHIARITLLSNKFIDLLNSNALEQIYRSVRPYGGLIHIAADKISQTKQLKSVIAESSLPKAETNYRLKEILIQRQGALPDSADWTHQYGDIANTVKSNDKRVKLPLGVLWFGGNTHDDILPRHGHGPPEQVIGGRTFLEGMNSLSARDVYTGQVLWHREFDNLGTFGIYFNSTYKETPLSTQYNQKHIPGANSRGTNYIATADKVYLAIGSECHVLNAVDGSTQKVIKLPKQNNDWAYIAVYEDILLAGNGFAHYGKQIGEKVGKDGPSAADLSASQGLIAYDRITGEKIWQIDAIHSFLHNGIVAGNGRIFCLDKLPASAEKKLSRRGMVDPSKYRIICLDALTGKELWTTKQNIFGSWLGYSEKYDILLQAGARAKDRLSDEIGQGMLAYQGDKGNVLWHIKDRKYTGPCVLHNNLIITSANSYEVSGGAFHIVDGTPYSIINPITKQKEPLKFSRTYGCNYVIASENLLTFRSGAAGFYDLKSQSGTGNFGGFKSSCTSNLVVANGVLNAPDYTRTCSCSYQNQTSLALIHMPEIEVWTNSQLGATSQSAPLVKQAGINFGAPGDRRSESGTLWLDYPSVGGPSPDLKVTISNQDFTQFRHHSLKIKAPLPEQGLNWVAASGIENPQKITIAINQKTNSKIPDGIAIAGVDDDAEEGSRGEVKLHSSDLELGLDGKDPSTVGLRFTNIPLKSAYDLEAAYIQFTVDELGNSSSKLKIQAENTTNSQPFVEIKKNVSSRKRTKAYIEWSPPAWLKVDASGTRQATPDLTILLKEILRQKKWKAGNSVSFLFTGKGTRIAKSYKGASGGSARLVLKTKSQSQLAKQSTPKEAKENTQNRYTIKLMFTEPDVKIKPGEREFKIQLQGKNVVPKLDIVKETGQAMRCLVKEFPGISINDQIEIELKSTEDSKHPPVISGIEVISEI